MRIRRGACETPPRGGGSLILFLLVLLGIRSGGPGAAGGDTRLLVLDVLDHRPAALALVARDALAAVRAVAGLRVLGGRSPNQRGRTEHAERRTGGQHAKLRNVHDVS